MAASPAFGPYLAVLLEPIKALRIRKLIWSWFDPRKIQPLRISAYQARVEEWMYGFAGEFMVNNTKQSEALFRRVTTAYTIALLVIAACGIAAFITITCMVKDKTEYARLINLSGRQRMLSQRIALFASQWSVAEGEAREAALKELLSSRDLFLHSHEILVGDQGKSQKGSALSKTIEEVFYGSPQLDERVRAYTTLVDQLIEPGISNDRKAELLCQMQEAAGNELLQDLDRVVKLFEKESDASNFFLLKIEFGLLLTLLLGIAFEARYIFAPMAGLVAKTTNQLDSNIRKMSWAANHDPATGIANRRRLREFIDRDVKDAIQQGESVAVLHIDLDRFKAVNDTFGHAAGDAILTNSASKLEEHVGDREIVARIGGDEFVVVVLNRQQEDLARLGETIIKEVSKPIRFENQECSVGCSIGVALSRPSESQPERLLLDADIALYEAKNTGRGRLEFVTHELTERYRTRERMQHEIVLGLENDEFLPFFQPQICGKTGKLIGLESLARWEKTPGEYRSAASFVGVAEELNLMDQIDRVMLKKGLAQFAHWKSEGLAIPQISFNFSMAKLRDVSFATWLYECVLEKNLDSSEIVIEILETVMFDEDSTQIIKNVNQLRDFGFKVDLDDFGSGHASINALLDLSVDRIKIDRSLTENICRDRNSRILLEAIVRLFDNLEIPMLIEGVDNMEQVNLLSDLHDFSYQGFFFGHPMNVHDFENWLTANERQPCVVNFDVEISGNIERWPTDWMRSLPN
ncbi:MAG: EAL domain-containing protein [Planctomycetota bacterium]